MKEDIAIAMGEANGRLYFLTYEWFQYELWSSDGTIEGTERLWSTTDNNVSWNSDRTHSDLVSLNNDVFFAIKGSVYRHDGIATTRIAQLRPEADISELTVAGGKLFFVANTEEWGRELWVSDGTEHGTQLAVDIREGIQSSIPSDLTVWNDRLYFIAADDQHGKEIWSIDTSFEVPLVGDLNSNGEVEFQDFLLLARNFNTSTDLGSTAGDLDNDGDVDFLDFLELAQHFGRKKPV